MDDKERRDHWILKIVDDLEQREERRLVFATAKTPSGPIHVGVGRELIYCSVFTRLLEQRRRETEFFFFVDDFDSLKSFPPNVPLDLAHKEYLGMPLYAVPCPYGDCESWGYHYARELIDNFPAFGLHPKIQWSHDIYRTPEMKALIRTALSKVEELRDILKEVVAPTLEGEKQQTFLRELKGWYPCLVVCEGCGRLKTGRVTGYNPEADTVTYICSACRRHGEVTIRDWPVKLRWRIDWPAKWALFKVSCEPAGKDHCVKGGAYNTGSEIVRRVFSWRAPYCVSYEWILLGQHAMKTHKGISFTFSEWRAVAPPETYRYFILRDDPRRHLSFAPERLPQLLDEFERAERIYFGVEKPVSNEESYAVKIIYPLSIPKDKLRNIPARLPYRFAVILTQLKPLLGKVKVKTKSIEVLNKLYSGRTLTEEEEAAVEERLNMAQYWVENYAPESIKITITESLPSQVKSHLDERQKEALKTLREMLQHQEWDEERLQYELFELGKRLGIKTKIFEAVYLAFLGTRSGPRLAPLLLSLEKDFVLKRLEEAVT